MINPTDKLLRRLPAALALLVFAAPPAWAAGEAPSSLATRVDRLTERVQTLEATVKRLEHELHAQREATPAAAGAASSVPAPAATAPTPNPAAAPQAKAASTSESPWIIKSKWQSIKKGMTSQQIHSLLGEPGQQFQLSGKTVWYYRYPGVGGGSIFFSNDGTVASWQRPPFGWW